MVTSPQIDHMRRTLSFLMLLLLSLAVSGCVNALRPASPPTDVRLRVRTLLPQQYSVRVALEKPVDYPVAADGRVSFTVPSFRHGCDWYLFGAIKVRDGAAEHARIVELRRAGRVVCKWSLAQIANLSRDEAGYGVVWIGDCDNLPLEFGIDYTRTSKVMDYGYSISNPIKLGGVGNLTAVEAERVFLRHLRDKSTNGLTFHRVGSFNGCPDGHIVDGYELESSDGNACVLYIDMYHPEIGPLRALAPNGFLFWK